MHSCCSRFEVTTKWKCQDVVLEVFKQKNGHIKTSSWRLCEICTLKKISLWTCTLKEIFFGGEEKSWGTAWTLLKYALIMIPHNKVTPLHGDCTCWRPWQRNKTWRVCAITTSDRLLLTSLNYLRVVWREEIKDLCLFSDVYLHVPTAVRIHCCFK